jgi:hypothetical protein
LVIGFPVSDIAVSAFRVDGDGVGERVVPTTGEAADWLEKAGLHGRWLLWSFEHYQPAHDLQLMLGPGKEDL